MESRTKKIIIWSLAVIATGIAIWQGTKIYQNHKADKLAADEEAKAAAAALLASLASSTPSKGKPVEVTETAINWDKVLKPGVSKSIELTAAKKRFNTIIESARSVSTPPNAYNPQAALVRENWRKAIANLPLLDIASEYGPSTKTVAQTILGRTDFTLKRLKDFHNDWNAKWGIK